MRALNRKLFRDLWRMKGQALAILLVIASGVATAVMSISTNDSLRYTQSVFYRDYRFADVFVSLKRAPLSLATQISEIPGVLQAETRVVAAARLEVENYSDPITGLIVSLPGHRPPTLNRLFLRSGRLPDPARENEAAVSESFALAHKLNPGDTLTAVINGRRRTLVISGVALTPEFTYPIAPGSLIPDFAGYGILWMARKPLAVAYGMDGAFNDAVLSIAPGVNPRDVVDRLDELTRRYGGRGAYARDDQISHRYLSEEFKQLEQMAFLFPAIFLGVAAFLLNVVITRLIATQREQIAILKAFGYRNLDLAIHYLEFVLMIVAGGAALGIATGVWLGQNLSQMYLDFYKFPFLIYKLTPEAVGIAVGVSAASAIAGTLVALIRAARLAPAEAMQPAPPGRYHRGLLEIFFFARRLGQPTRMIIRNLERRPVKALLTVTGAAFAVAILVSGMFFRDAVDLMIDVQFKLANRYDLTVTFTDPTPRRALSSLAALEGAGHIEPFRSVPARLRHGHRSYLTSLDGHPPGAQLRRLLDHRFQQVALPPEGVLLTDALADLLHIRPGDLLTVEVLEGARPIRQVPVVGTIKEYVGVFGYMDLDALNRLMREDNLISGAWMTTNPDSLDRLFVRLKQMPRVAGATMQAKALQNFQDTMAEQMLTFAFFNTILASVVAFGVVFNSARIALSERARELASLRVLGFTRGEVAYILIGEMALLIFASFPLGLLIGRGISAFAISNVQTDLFRVPLVIHASTDAFAIGVVLVSALVSVWLIKRDLDRLDLVEVLKTKE
jgi:putative ABC transport system permease protein